MRWTTNDVMPGEMQVRRCRRDAFPCPNVKRGRGRGEACGVGRVKYRLAQRTVDAAIGIALRDVRVRGGGGPASMMHGVYGGHQYAADYEGSQKHHCRNVPPRVHGCAYLCVF